MEYNLLLGQRGNISDVIITAVRAMIVDGRLLAGSRINEVHLAKQLGVSRTPLREALSRLVVENAITNAPRIGFHVRPLSVAEFEQLYDLRPLLDPEALRLSGLPSIGRLAVLDELNDRLLKADDPEIAIEIDDAWHMELLAECPNKELLQLIQAIMMRTRRYEIALMREQDNRDVAIGDHKQILSALHAGNLRSACTALKRNMQSGREPIINWLKSREKISPPA
jgi:DNA-binding GntR family transcriptional regulator